MIKNGSTTILFILELSRERLVKMKAYLDNFLIIELCSKQDIYIIGHPVQNK